VIDFDIFSLPSPAVNVKFRVQNKASVMRVSRMKGLMGCVALAALISAPALAQQGGSATTGDAFMDTAGLTSQKAAASSNASLAVKPQKGDTTFLMSAFNATSENALSIFSSYDGATFTSTASEAYRPATGLLRDPSIMQAADGTYYVTYTTSWGGTTFGVAKSRDLKHWDHVADVDVGLPGVTNVWAPEWFRDSDGSVSIVVSLSMSGTKGPFAAYALKATDIAAGKFSAPVAMTGLGDNHIDTFVVKDGPVKDGDTYYAFTKNETAKTIELATAKALTGPWTIEKTGDWAGWGDWIEGPAVVRLPNKGWRIYFDDYRTKTYWYSDSFDGFKTWSKKQELGGVSGAVRHFTVIAQPTATVDAALKPQGPAHTITWDRHSLMIDGKRLMIWSGEFQPFRLPSPSMWRDVLQKMKATGYNTVTLYIDWGYHSPKQGRYDFSGVRNIERVLDMAEDSGLYVIIRPGPYVNAELSMGGFPGWVTRQKAMARTDDPQYIAAVDEWQTQIDAIIARHQLTTGGGTVIAYQIENELGDTSESRKRYMQHLADKVHADGITVPLFHNSAGRLPNWTPRDSTAPWAVSGPTDLYAFDGYPGGGCNGTREIGKPNIVPNWGMYGSTEPDKSGVVKAGALSSPNTPGFAAEIGGGWFDYWGSEGTYDCTAQRVGSAYIRTDYGSSLINGLTMHSVYMAFGGTSWGWLPATVVYSSYDYGAGIDEARHIRPKQLTFKQIGQFVQAATPLLTDLDKGAPLAASTDAVKLYHDVGAKGEGDLIFAIHNPSNATTDDAFSFKLTTKDGAYDIKTQLNGQDAKLLLADYPLERQHLVYTTSDTQTHFQAGPRDLALLYGRAGEPGETVLRYASKPTVRVLSGDVQTAFDARTGDLKLDYSHKDLARVAISGGGRAPLLLLIAEDSVAQQFWKQGALLERSTALIREGSVDGKGRLHLTGDTTAPATIEVWGDLGQPKTIDFDGRELAVTAQPDGSWLSTTIPGPAPVTLPDLMAQPWVMRQDSPEADPAFDDTAWRKADLKDSTALKSTQPPAGEPVLNMTDYGFYHGAVWYRGRFTVARDAPNTADIFYGGGGAGLMQLWIDGKFIGQDEVPSGVARPKGVHRVKLALPALAPGAHQISVMVINDSHNWDLGANDEHKEARGLISLELGKAGDAPLSIDWKIQGERGGEDIPDLVRGPINNGGLYGERMGWYLPARDDAGWTPAKVTDAPPAPGTYWLRTHVTLDLPQGQDTQLGLQIGDPGKAQSSHVTRAILFINGWHVGHYIADVGPQHVFVIPPGILDGHGANTLTLAVTSDGKAANAFEPVRLVVLDAARGGVPVEPVPSPSSTQR
jgi:beta-galactosidase GanA